MNKTGSKFKSDDFSPEKRESWFERNRCQYTYRDKPCMMLGTSSSQGGEGGRYFCAYHVEVMHDTSKASFQNVSMEDKPKFNREHFGTWFKSHHSQSVTPDQFTGFFTVNNYNDPNLAPLYSKEQESKMWNKVKCGHG